jgi:MinD-like ATPase involved in chromosome partitioning or flagellar assembly
VGLIAVASAKGSPGATTTALLLGALWPRPVIVAECDPHGGDTALRMPTVDGGTLDPDRGLLSLGAAGRKSLHADLVPEHTQTVVGGLDVLVGVRTPEQSAGLAQQWGQLGPIFATVPGHDVIADAGRVGAATPQNVLLASASDLVLVCDDEPSNVVHLRERILALEAKLRPDSASGTRIHVLVVADVRRRRAVSEVAAVLERTSVPVSDVHQLARDPRGAGFFSGRIQGRADRTALVRSARPVAAELAAATEAFFVPGPEQADSDPSAWPGWNPESAGDHGPAPTGPQGTVLSGGEPR